MRTLAICVTGDGEAAVALVRRGEARAFLRDAFYGGELPPGQESVESERWRHFSQTKNWSKSVGEPVYYEFYDGESVIRAINLGERA